jgi:hypothetical protein
VAVPVQEPLPHLPAPDMPFALANPDDLEKAAPTQEALATDTPEDMQDTALSLAPDVFASAPADTPLEETAPTLAEEPSAETAPVPQDVLEDIQEPLSLPAQDALWNEADSEPCLDAGRFFLKAALWELEREPLLGKALVSLSGFALEDKKDLEQLEDRFFLLPLEETAADARPGVTLDRRTTMMLESLMADMLTQVNVVVVATEQKKIFSLSPDLRVVYEGRRDQAGMPGFLFKTIELVTERLVDNVEPLVSVMGAVTAEEFEACSALARALEGVEDRVSRVELVDGRGNTVSLFEALLPMSRKYVLVAGGQTGDVFLSNIFDVITQKELLIKRVKNAFMIESLHYGHSIVEKVVKLQEDMAECPIFMGDGRIIENIAGFLPKCVLAWFLSGQPAEQRWHALREIVTISGRVRKNSQMLQVCFHVPEGFTFPQELLGAITMVQKRAVHDFDGRRLVFSQKYI